MRHSAPGRFQFASNGTTIQDSQFPSSGKELLIKVGNALHFGQVKKILAEFIKKTKVPPRGTDDECKQELMPLWHCLFAILLDQQIPLPEDQATHHTCLCVCWPEYPALDRTITSRPMSPPRTVKWPLRRMTSCIPCAKQLCSIWESPFQQSMISTRK